MEKALNLRIPVNNARFDIYLLSGFYRSHGNRWQILHCHPNYEIQIFEKGHFDFFLSNASLRIDAPAVLLLRPYINHSFYSDSEDAERVCVEFAMTKEAEGSAFEDYYELLSEFGDYKMLNGFAPSLSPFRSDIPNRMPYEKDALLVGALSQMIINMFAQLRLERQNGKTSPEIFPSENKRNELLANILRYIESHFTEKITLNDVAKANYISPRQLERLLHNELKQSLTDIVNRCRVENICREMLGGNEDYSALSSKNGFADYSTFWRNFKRITGMSPLQFLKSRNT